MKRLGLGWLRYACYFADGCGSLDAWNYGFVDFEVVVHVNCLHVEGF